MNQYLATAITELHVYFSRTRKPLSATKTNLVRKYTRIAR